MSFSRAHYIRIPEREKKVYGKEEIVTKNFRVLKKEIIWIVKVYRVPNEADRLKTKNQVRHMAEKSPSTKHWRKF